MTRPADRLIGKTIGSGWVVETTIQKNPKGTGGRFSTGYIVSKDGKKAFLKAMDLSEALLQEDQLWAIRSFAEIIQFEGDVLAECLAKRMSKVVQLIEGGNLEIDDTETNPIAKAASRVYFYIFELADSDARAYFSSPDDTSCAAKLHALHHVSLAIQQLHASGIAHQDIKPSNVVRFTNDEHKVADLGRASVIGKAGPTDSMLFPGDWYYMPPEFAYGYFPPEALDRRLGTDVYLLGSLLSFLFTLQGASTLLREALPKGYLPNVWGGGEEGWTGAYVDVLPQLLLAHSRVCDYLAPQIPEGCRVEILAAYKELTHPDPFIRGNPKARRMVGRMHGLDRYVSLFDRLQKRAEVNQKFKRPAPAL